MSARLQELLRQKALLAEHAAWLDREIALEQALQGGAGAAPLPAPLPLAATMPVPAVPPPSPMAAAATAAPTVDTEADAIIAQYREAEKSSPQRIKWGCIVYVAAGLALVILAFVGIYLLAHRR